MVHICEPQVKAAYQKAIQVDTTGTGGFKTNTHVCTAYTHHWKFWAWHAFEAKHGWSTNSS